MQLLAWALIAPIYLTARIGKAIIEHRQPDAMRQAAWANAVAAEHATHGKSH